MASISGNNKIVLRARYSEGGAEHEEGILTAAATPGMNVQMGVTAENMGSQYFAPGNTDNVGTGTSTTTSKNPIKIVKEDPLIGKTINDAYSSGDRVFIHLACTGEVLQVLVASGQNIAKGDGLSANSAGKFIGDTTNAAVEALESTGGALSEDTHVRVRVL